MTQHTTSSRAGMAFGLSLGIGLAVAIPAVAVIIALGDQVRTVALLALGGLIAIGLVAAAALPIRAWRKNDAPPVIQEHYFHDGTRTIEKHTIDGRTVGDTRILQLPPAQQGAGFPELLRAAWSAGQLSPNRAAQPDSYRPLDELDPANPATWCGDIRP